MAKDTIRSSITGVGYVSGHPGAPAHGGSDKRGRDRGPDPGSSTRGLRRTKPTNYDPTVKRERKGEAPDALRGDRPRESADRAVLAMSNRDRLTAEEVSSRAMIRDEVWSIRKDAGVTMTM